MKVNPIQKVQGNIRMPGDKSISHRAVIFSALQNRKSRINNILLAEDVRHHWEALARLGVDYSLTTEGVLEVKGVGLPLPKGDYDTLYLGNSGTAMRLLSGLFAGSEGVKVQLSGDASLVKRPMARVQKPLNQFGANIALSAANTAPIIINGKKLQSINYKSELSSAQVKSALFLAGLASQVSVQYSEPHKSRDHTERFFSFLGLDFAEKNSNQEQEFHYTLNPPYNFSFSEFSVPGDISSAAFFMALSTLIQDSSLTILDIGLNDSRTGVITAMREMGANIEIESLPSKGEKRGNLIIRSAALEGKIFSGAIIPNIIDEIPILAVMASFASGVTEFRDAGDLRNKESDRISAVCENLRSCGVETEEWADGFRVYGQPRVQGGLVQSYLDHRIAMAFAVLGAASQEGVEIDDTSWIETSFPNFFTLFKEVTHGNRN